MNKKQIEELVKAYNACLKKEKQIEKFFSMKTDCCFLEEIESCLFEALTEGIPEEKHFEISKMIGNADVDGIYTLHFDWMEEEEG